MRLVAIRQPASLPPASVLLNDGQSTFLTALRDLDQDQAGERHARLLEQVIRESRRVGTDDNLLPEEACDALDRLRERYHLLAPIDLCIDPVTYRTARCLIAALFF